MAPPPDMDPQARALSGLDRGPCSLHRGSGRGAGRPRPGQYVILGAGLDTFAQRRPEIASRLRVFEVDQPGPQAWKRQRLIELGFGVPEWLRLVPVDFEAGDAWWERLAAAGSTPSKPAVVASTGVSMYLTKDAIAATLRQVAALAPGSTLAMTFLLPLELADPEVRPGLETAAKGARASGTPFISFFTPAEMLALAREAGFQRGAARVGGDAHRALLRGQDGRPAPAEQRRGAAGRDDLAADLGNCGEPPTTAGRHRILADTAA